VKLSEWQTQFSEAIKGRPSEGAPQTEAQAARLAVYQRGYWIRLSGSLREDFPLTLRLLGKDVFFQLVTDFLATERGFQPDLGELSDVFAAYVRSRFPGKPVARAAHLDLQAVHAFLAPEAEPGGRYFGLHPSVRLLADGQRFYLSWRSENGVERSRLAEAGYQLLASFDPPAELSEISQRLDDTGLDPVFVRSSVEEWSREGLVVPR
jgi:hypothetical protein